MMRPTDISNLGDTLATCALRTIIIGAVAALGLSLSRVRTTSVRLFVWRSVLAAAIVIPALGACLPPWRIQLPEFGQTSPAVKDGPRGHEVPFQHTRTKEESVTLPKRGAVERRHATSAHPLPGINSTLRGVNWKIVAFAIYLVVAAVLLMRFVIGLLLGRRLVRLSRPILDVRLHRISLAHDKSTRLFESDSVCVPITMGVLKPVVLLPLGWSEWDDTQLNAVITHELSHVTRRDTLTQYFALLHRAVFWFSPFAWWLDRHLAALAQLASDEAALASGTDRQAYANTLVGFFDTLRAAPGRIHWQGVSMANGGQAELRVQRILGWKGVDRMGLSKSVIVAIITVAIPVVYLAASARPAIALSGSVTSGQSSTPTAPVPSSPSAPTIAPTVGVAEFGPTGGVDAPKIVGTTSTAGVTEIEPVAPVSSSYAYASGQSSAGGSSSGGYYRYGYDDDDRFIIVSGKTDSYTMSGSTQDIHHVERLKKQIPGDFIWFQRDEQSYIIRDQSTIDRAKAFWAPQEELGRKQEELGKKQEALGRQQEELGRRQEQVHINVPPDLASRLDALKSRLQKLGPNATMEQMGDLQSEIGDLQSKIGELQSQAGEQQGKLGEEQGRLGEQQGKLGEEQGKLGEEQGRLAEEASRKTKALFDECIKNGKAQPEPRGPSGASL